MRAVKKSSRRTPLALPRGAVNGFGQAADFYDSLGANVHWKVGSGPYASITNTLADIRALGIRHIRDAITGSWYDTTYQYHRAAMIAIRNHNKALPGGEQPIFCMIFPSGFTGQQPFTDFSFTEEDWLDSFDGGRPHWLAQVTPRTQIANGTTSSQSAAIPNPWNYNDPEFDWGYLACYEGPNEPSSTNLANINAWSANIYRKLKARTAKAFYGLPAITEKGISRDIRVSQLPVIAPSIINAGQMSTLGDWTTGNPKRADAGCVHFYSSGHEPSVEYADSFLNQNPSAFNGTLRAGGADLSKTLPFIVTEFGHISAGVDAVVYPAPFHAGHWPAPDDVIAEHMVRTFVLWYLKGVRRSYIYEFYDEGTAAAAEQRFGLLTYTRTKKEQFYSIRNLLSLVGFQEAPKAQQQKLTISVSGFVSTGNNDHIGMFSGTGDFGTTGVGQVYHRNADRLDTLQLQRSATEWLLIIMRQVMIWDREVGNWSGGAPASLGDVASGRKTPNTQTLTVQLPSGVTEVREATPTAGGTSTPEDGRTYSAPLTINGSNQVSVSIQSKTKILKIVKP